MGTLLVIVLALLVSCVDLVTLGPPPQGRERSRPGPW